MQFDFAQGAKLMGFWGTFVNCQKTKRCSSYPKLKVEGCHPNGYESKGFYYIVIENG